MPVASPRCIRAWNCWEKCWTPAQWGLWVPITVALDSTHLKAAHCTAHRLAQRPEAVKIAVEIKWRRAEGWNSEYMLIMYLNCTKEKIRNGEINNKAVLYVVCCCCDCIDDGSDDEHVRQTALMCRIYRNICAFIDLPSSEIAVHKQMSTVRPSTSPW